MKVRTCISTIFMDIVLYALDALKAVTTEMLEKQQILSRCVKPVRGVCKILGVLILFISICSCTVRKNNVCVVRIALSG